MDRVDHSTQRDSTEEQVKEKPLKEEVDEKGAVPAPIPLPKLFPELDGKEYETKLSSDLVKNTVKDSRILLMTATDVELRGVLGYLKPLDGRDKVIKSFINGTWIYVGMYGGYSVVVGRSAYSKGQQGGLNACLITNKIMEIYKPRYIIAVGICFGMDRSKVNLGDVIVSNFIVDFFNFRKQPEGITARKSQPPAGATLLRFFGDTSKFEIKHSDQENPKEVKVHCGPIASTPALVDDPKFKEELREVHPDALGGEIEGAGIFRAASNAEHRPEAIVIKAVADWGDGKKAECRGWKDFASHAAATYVHDRLNNASPDAFSGASPDASPDASIDDSLDIEEWLKGGMVDLTIKRVLMHGLPGSGKTCSQRLLLNQDPPEEDNSTPIACRAVKATRISAHDDRMERVDAKALLSSLAHDLKEAATKQKEPPPEEDHSTESKEEFSETKTTESAELVGESGEITKSTAATESAEATGSTVTTETEDPADDTEANIIINDIVKEIPNAKGKFDRHWVYIVDSGGQTAFQELLPLFTRASSFNIITLDLSKDIDEEVKQEYRINGESLSQIDKSSAGDSKPFSCTNIQFLKDALSSGAILQPYQAPQPIGSEENTSNESTAPQCPRYFVLGTHKDKKKPGVIEKYNDELKKLKLGSEKKGYRIIPAIENSDTIIYAVNTMLPHGPEREEETKKLCRIIYHEVSGDKIPIPVRWFAFELTLLKKAEREGRSFLRIKDVLLAGKSLQMNKAQTEKALEFLHSVTIILYYPQVLPDVVFVDPHPILDMLSRLLALATYQIPQDHLDHFVKKTSLLYELEEDLKCRGLFTLKFLKNLKGGEDFSESGFIELLLHLRIIVETDKKDESKEKEYFIPSALPPCPKTRSAPKSDIDPLQIIWCSRESELEDSYEILPVPRGIFFLAIVNLMKRSKPLQFRFASKSPEYFRYRDAMSFRIHHQEVYIGTVHIIKKDRCIEIYFEAQYDLEHCPRICKAVKEAIASSCEAINIKPDGYEFAFDCPSTEGCYRIVTNEDEKKMKCTLPGTKSPTNSGKEQHWSWFESSTEERGLDDADGSPRNADSSDPVQTITDSNALSKTVSDDTTQDNTAPAPTIAKDGATSTVGAEEGQPSAQVNQPPTTGGGNTVFNIYNINSQVQGQGNNCTVSGSTQTSTNLFNSMNTVTVAGKEEKVSDDVTKGIEFLLMTATDSELEGVLEHLKPLDGRDEVIEQFKNGVDLYIGKYGKHPVVVGQSAHTKGQQGALPALVVTNKMMEIFEPKYIIAIGVCFGMDEKVNLGDVIVSDRIADLYNIRVEDSHMEEGRKEEGRMEEGHTEEGRKQEGRMEEGRTEEGRMKKSRMKARITDAVQAGDTLVSLFRNPRNDIVSLIGKSCAFKMVKPSFDKENAKEVEVHCGPMVSAPFLVNNLEFKEKLREVRSDALAGEMEGVGIFLAARNAHPPKPEAIVIKAVADLADGKKDEYKDWKLFACQAAAAYVLHHLDDDRTSEL